MLDDSVVGVAWIDPAGGFNPTLTWIDFANEIKKVVSDSNSLEQNARLFQSFRTAARTTCFVFLNLLVTFSSANGVSVTSSMHSCKLIPKSSGCGGGERIFNITVSPDDTANELTVAFSACNRLPP